MKKIILILIVLVSVACADNIYIKNSSVDKKSKLTEINKIELRDIENGTDTNSEPKEFGEGVIFGVVINIPHQFFGVNVIAVWEHRLGWYFDLKFPSTGSGDYSNISVTEAEDVFHDGLIKKKNDWTSFNVGRTKVISNHIFLYAGTGLSLCSKMYQYYDSFEILGNDGRYWVIDDDESKIVINFLGGMVIKIKPHQTIQIGCEFQPFGITVGYGYLFR